MILLFTGNGKGKTTAALGQAVRALGQGSNVLVIQFIKGPWKTGEDNFASNFNSPTGGPISKFQIKKTGKGFVGILGDKLPLSEHKKSAQAGLKLAEKAIRSKNHDLIILDEINNAVGLKLIKASEVIKILKIPQTPFYKGGNGPDIILTGRNAPKSFIKIADIVTEMKEIKHPFQTNKKSMKKRVEY